MLAAAAAPVVLVETHNQVLVVEDLLF